MNTYKKQSTLTRKGLKFPKSSCTDKTIASQYVITTILKNISHLLSR